ncbi:MAG: hypothetical protein L3K17_06720 [Thermoplasmata archaeon]|nr:hypothetical protein [Thermoplasmata archaeon]
MTFRRSNRGAATLPAVVLGIVLLAVAVLAFLGIYLALPGQGHFYALIWIGVLALVFAAISYVGSALTRDPSAVRLATFGFLGMGFAVLLLTIGVGPDNPLNQLGQIVGLIIVLVLLVGVVFGARWRANELGRENRRSEQRTEWTSTPPKSALDYAAAQTAPAPPAATPPSGSPSPPRSGGSA